MVQYGVLFSIVSFGNDEKVTIRICNRQNLYTKLLSYNLDCEDSSNKRIKVTGNEDDFLVDAIISGRSKMYYTETNTSYFGDLYLEDGKIQIVNANCIDDIIEDHIMVTPLSITYDNRLQEYRIGVRIVDRPEVHKLFTDLGIIERWGSSASPNDFMLLVFYIINIGTANKINEIEKIINNKESFLCMLIIDPVEKKIYINDIITGDICNIKRKENNMNKSISTIVNTGDRRKFESGAVRDIDDTKGRCDLMPLRAVAMTMDDHVLPFIDDFITYGEPGYLCEAIEEFTKLHFKDMPTAMLEVSVHYKDGANKYEERNWEKGIPLHSFIDSAVRHYLKFVRGDKDERHDRAFIWNLLGAIWTLSNKPEQIDIQFRKEKQNENYKNDSSINN